MYFIYSISFNPNTLGNPCHDSSHSGSPCSGDPEYVESAIEQNILEENLLQFLPFQKKKKLEGTWVINIITEEVSFHIQSRINTEYS